MEKKITVVLKDTDTMLTFLARCREEYIVNRGGPNFRMLHDGIKENFRKQLQALNEEQPVDYFSIETLRPTYASHIGNALIKLVAYVMNSKNIVSLPLEQQELAANVIQALYQSVFQSIKDDYQRIDDFIMLSTKRVPFTKAVEKTGEMVLAHELRNYVRDLVFRNGMTEQERTNTPLADILSNIVKSVLPFRKFEIIIGENKRRYGAYHGSAYQQFYCAYVVNALANSLLSVVREYKEKSQK